MQLVCPIPPAPLYAEAASDGGSDIRPQLVTDRANSWIAVWESRDTLGGTIDNEPDIFLSLGTVSCCGNGIVEPGEQCESAADCAAEEICQACGCAPPECGDGLDNDADGLTDFPDDLGCASADDLSERSPLRVCDDGVDNDSDNRVDYPADPGCGNGGSVRENPQCQDGIDNDSDGGADFDGGESIYGVCSAGVCPPGVSDPELDGIANPAPQCVAPFRNRELPDVKKRCSVGAEVVILLPLVWWLRTRKRLARTKNFDS